jgi:hypothetical protein
VGFKGIVTVSSWSRSKNYAARQNRNVVGLGTVFADTAFSLILSQAQFAQRSFAAVALITKTEKLRLHLYIMHRKKRSAFIQSARFLLLQERQPLNYFLAS